ncbi:hypothetical protein AAFF_G00265460 [Aldrovandia affinis]|uniref:Uncharacterized protein n=1 Tax=Aldrovandia affinis TaxID=143900 RepID=A0AAD7RBG9_9TELE|nr:hypothetical protein AAFF_G00265460 [Aldrovandia affinis]
MGKYLKIEPADREQQSLGAFGIKEEPPEGALESADPHGEPKNSGERGGGLDSLTHERPGALGTLVPQWTPDTEARDSYSTETAQSGMSFSGCSDATPEAVSAGPVPASEAFETRGGCRGDEGQSQEALPDWLRERAQIPSAESSLVSDGPATVPVCGAQGPETTSDCPFLAFNISSGSWHASWAKHASGTLGFHTFH